MSAAELDSFYQAEYRRLYQGKEDPIQKDLVVQRKRAQATLAFAQNILPASSITWILAAQPDYFYKPFNRPITAIHTVWSLGSLTGSMRKSAAWQSWQRSRNFLAKLRGSFDLVSMMHVLEHIPDPVKYLAQIRENYLKPAGWLLLEAPNLYAHDSFETAHLFSFSAHTLVQTVSKAGFNILAIRKHGLPRSQNYPIVRDPDRAVTRLRW